MARKKYFWTPEQDAFIREHYDSANKNRSKELAAALGVPRWVVNRRARDLGLSKLKERPWSPAELEYLGQWYHRTSVKKIAQRLGRSVTAVRLKAKRVGYRKYAEGYTASSLATALGVDNKWVRDRIAKGIIKASQRQTERRPEQGGDAWLITEQAFIDFLRDHPYEIDLRKVDQLWFLDILRELVNGNYLTRNKKGSEL